MQVMAHPADSTVSIPRKFWTREEAHALVDLGFPNAEKLELIEGDLIDRMGKKRRHILWQHLMLAWLQGVFGAEYVQSESPSDVSAEDNETSEPEPDLMVTTRSIREYVDANPGPEDIRLVIEISDSTLRFDLKVKATLYARAEIQEYWVIDISDRRLIVHRDPVGDLYASVSAYASNEPVAPLAAPHTSFCLDGLSV